MAFGKCWGIRRWPNQLTIIIYHVLKNIINMKIYAVASYPYLTGTRAGMDIEELLRSCIKKAL